MKQTEKLDIILKQLYDFKFDKNFHDIKEILSDKGISVSLSEAIALAKRLKELGYINSIPTIDFVMGEITSKGVEYCEGDSFTHKGSAVINNNYEIKIENSPGANIVSHSNNVTITNQVNNIPNILEILEKILSSIERDENVECDKKDEIKECAKEIKNSLNVGQIPKFGFNSFLGLIGDISSVSSLAVTLGQMICQ